jgi:hypothetical protein
MRCVFLNQSLLRGDMRKTVSLFVLAILCLPPKVYAQDGYFANWFDRVDKT